MFGSSSTGKTWRSNALAATGSICILAGSTALAAAAQPVAEPVAGRATAVGNNAPKVLPTGAALTLEMPATLNWKSEEGIPLSLMTKLAAAEELSLAAGPFVDTATGKPLQVKFCIARHPGGRCLVRPTLRANAQTNVWAVGRGRAEPGSYSGTVSLISTNGLSASKSLTLTATDDRWRFWGLVALVLGVLLSFFMTVWLPHQRARDLSVLPFAQLRQRLAKARAKLGSNEGSHVKAKIHDYMEELDPISLAAEGLVPGRWPSATPTEPPAEQVKQRVEELSARVAAAETLAFAIRSVEDAQKKLDLDALAQDPAFPNTDLASRIATTIAGTRSTFRAASVKAIRPADIIMREETRNMAFWLVSSLLSVMLGYVLLVDSDPTFGGWADVAAALLWGLGLSTAGSKLADLTVGQVRTGLRPAAGT
jgi:hypothetical protein